MTIGEVGGGFMVAAVVYTERSETVRIISARPAARYEKKEQKEQYDCQDNT